MWSISRRRAAVALQPGPGPAREFLEPLGLSAGALARANGVPRNRLIGIINGKRAVTADTALRLGICFGTSGEFWLSLQASHDLKLARREIGERPRRETTPARRDHPSAVHNHIDSALQVAQVTAEGARLMPRYP